MRKFVLAAAIATSALGLAACGETADSVEGTDEAMAADAEAISEDATATGEEAADATAEAAEGAADAVEEAAEEAAADAEATVEGEKFAFGHCRLTAVSKKKRRCREAPPFPFPA